MANEKTSQVRFKFQAPAAAVYRVGPTGSGMLFTSIQAAINAAVADGYTSNDNPALVEIYPGVYTENVSFKPGVNVTMYNGFGSAFSGANGGGGLCTILGNHDYTVSNGLTRAQNAIAISSVNLTCLNGVTMTVAGTSPCQITFNGLTMQKQSGGDNNPVFRATNSGANTRIRLQNGGVFDNNVAGSSVVVDIQQSVILEMRDRTSSFISNNSVTAAIGLRLSNTAQFRVTNSDGVFYGSYSTACIELTSASNVVNLQWTQLTNTNNGAGASLISYNAAGAINAVRLRWCLLHCSSATGYLAKNTSGNGGAWQQGSNSIIITAGGTSGNVQNGITIGTDPANATNAA